MILKLNSSLIFISLRTERAPLVSQANLVNCSFSSGLSTFPVKNILPSITLDFTDKRYFLSLTRILAVKFFCIIESSICVPTVLGSNATETPVPKIPFEETPIQPDKIIPDLKNYFSDRKIVFCREITKLHEEFIRKNIDDLELFTKEPKGELTIVISEKNNNKKTSHQLSESDKNNIRKMINKLSIKEITSFISQTSKVSKKEIYNYCLELKNES